MWLNKYLLYMYLFSCSPNSQEEMCLNCLNSLWISQSVNLYRKSQSLGGAMWKKRKLNIIKITTNCVSKICVKLASADFFNDDWKTADHRFNGYAWRWIPDYMMCQNNWSQMNAWNSHESDRVYDSDGINKQTNGQQRLTVAQLCALRNPWRITNWVRVKS